MRLFIAIELDPEMKAALTALQDELMQNGIRGNRSKEENLHLTLAFIGEYPDPDDVLEVMSHTAFSPFSISLGKIGTFGDEIGLSQIMIAIDPSRFNDTETTDRIVQELVADIQSSVPIREGGQIFYPGEMEMNNRRDNRENGIPVNEEVWDLIRSK